MENQKVWISWNDEKPVMYQFDTLPELNAFLFGCETACDVNGMMTIEQFDTVEEARAWNEEPA